MTQSQPSQAQAHSQPQPSYASSRLPVREDVALVHQQAFAAIARAGTWWTGAERLAIASEARAARDCALCRERKDALSPFSVDGEHHRAPDTRESLTPGIVDVVHRLVTDPGRLTQSWYERVLAEGSLETENFAEKYVELVSVAVVVHAVDIFARGIGLASSPLPEAIAGEPSRVRPESARVDGAWVAQIPSGPLGGEDWRALYGDSEFVPQIGRALSLVPAAVQTLQAFSGPHYMELDHVSNPGYSTPGRQLDRMQMELIASRVSAINECFY